MNLELPHAVRARPVRPDADLGDPTLYFNRELSWLDFNRRVLAQALDPALPVLERVRFLAITNSNLDEFVQKRVGGLRRQQAAFVTKPSPDGRLPSELVRLVRGAVHEMQEAIDGAWVDGLKPLLEKRAGVRVLPYASLRPGQREALAAHFHEHLYPILTPMAVDPGHPFPFISNLSLSLAIEMRDPRPDTRHFARLKVPTRGVRWLRVPDAGGSHDFVAVEEVVRDNVSALFPGLEVLQVYAFRVTRNADLEREEEEAEDLIEMISEELRERQLAPVVRLEVERDMPDQIRRVLLSELELEDADLVELDGELGLEALHELADVDLPEHRFPHWEPVVPARLSTREEEDAGDRSIFSIIRDGDLLVHHPYESFTASVQRLAWAAAEDPAVLAIKQTLYRTSERSSIVEALLRAAAKGKQVAVMVEVKARFDEQNNIEWARILETAGVHVTYGVLGLKTHAKAMLIIREEDGHPRTYCHIGTGNYHAGDARIYTDLGLLTCDATIGADLVRLFHSVTGVAPGQTYDRLVVAPAAMRTRFLELIQREIDHASAGRVGRIIAKMNALDDEVIVRKLYEASRAGVTIDLVIRGHCSLRPGLAGVSENIRVVSIIGRFLEHDRIFLFGNDGDAEVFMGSADWRKRNLDSRVEALAPILDPDLRQRLTRILELAMADNCLAWALDANGVYHRREPQSGEPRVDLHRTLMEDATRGREDEGRGTRRRRRMSRAPAQNAAGTSSVSSSIASARSS
jgi:polyphosphate kinase